MNEWSLLIFTYMMNAAAGLCVMSGVFAVHLSRCLPADSFKRFMMLTIFIICTIAGAGSVASITHLGVPLNAPNAVNNVFSAWLSREVVVTAAFVGALGVSFLWLWKTGKFSFLLYGGAMAVGLADIFCMASIYRYTSILTWNDINTYLMFYGTTLTLGAVLFVPVVMVIRKAGHRADYTARRHIIIITAVAAVGSDGGKSDRAPAVSAVLCALLDPYTADTQINHIPAVTH